MFFFWQFQQNSSGNRKRTRQLRAPSLLDSRYSCNFCNSSSVVASFFFFFRQFQQNSSGIRKRTRQLRAPSLLDSIFSCNFCNSSSLIAIFFFFFRNFSKTATETASEHDSCGHRRCWTAATWCPCHSCRRRARPVGLVIPCGYCSRTRCGALCFVDDDGRALFVG